MEPMRLNLDRGEAEASIFARIINVRRLWLLELKRTRLPVPSLNAALGECRRIPTGAPSANVLEGAILPSFKLTWFQTFSCRHTAYVPNASAEGFNKYLLTLLAQRRELCTENMKQQLLAQTSHGDDDADADTSPQQSQQRQQESSAVTAAAAAVTTTSGAMLYDGSVGSAAIEAERRALQRELTLGIEVAEPILATERMRQALAVGGTPLAGMCVYWGSWVAGRGWAGSMTAGLTIAAKGMLEGKLKEGAGWFGTTSSPTLHSSPHYGPHLYHADPVGTPMELSVFLTHLPTHLHTYVQA